jgi:hypothetical protein
VCQHVHVTLVCWLSHRVLGHLHKRYALRPPDTCHYHAPARCRRLYDSTVALLEKKTGEPLPNKLLPVAEEGGAKEEWEGKAKGQGDQLKGRKKVA